MVRGTVKPSGFRLAHRGTPVVAMLAIVLAGCASRADPAESGASTGTGTSAATTSSAPSSAATTSSAPNSTPIPSSAPTIPKAIGGITWLLVRAVVGGTTYHSPQPAGSSMFTSYTLQFTKGRIEANDACNSIGVTATMGAHTVTSSGGVTMTAVGCPSSALREAYDRELFTGSMGWTVSSRRLTLTTDGDTFEYEPWPTGYPSDRAGVKHATTAEHSNAGVRFRIYAMPRSSGGDQCLTMEFDSPASTPWEPVSACRDNLAAQYVVNPTDFTSERLPSGTGIMFSAVPDGVATRIVFRPNTGGVAIGLTQTPLPGTKFQAFYGFVEHAKGGGTVTFYDAKGKPYHDTWKISW